MVVTLEQLNFNDNQVWDKTLGDNPEKLINRSKEFTLEKIGPQYEEILDISN